MASTEDKAYEIMRELDVNYVLVIFGGLAGYSSDGKLNHHNITMCWCCFILVSLEGTFKVLKSEII